MKKFALIALLNITAVFVYSQSLGTQHIGSAGEQLTGSQGSITFHLGEMVAQDQGRIQSGVIQYIQLSTILEKTIDLSGVRVFPNPTSGPIRIQHDIEKLTDWLISDVHGRIVESVSNTSTDVEAQLNLSPGKYYLIPSIHGTPQGGIPLTIIH